MSVARLNIAKENCSFSLFSVVTLCILSFFCWQWKKESQRKLSRSKRITTDTSARSKAAIKVRLLCVVKRGPQMMTLKKPAKPLVKKPVAKKPIVTMTTKIDQIITRRRKQNQQFKKSHLMKLTLSNQKHLSRGGGGLLPALVHRRSEETADLFRLRLSSVLACYDFVNKCKFSHREKIHRKNCFVSWRQPTFSVVFLITVMCFLVSLENVVTSCWMLCFLGFRKPSLVEYHVKYYHTSDGTPVQPPPPRKRRKTTSVCEYWANFLWITCFHCRCKRSAEHFWTVDVWNCKKQIEDQTQPWRCDAHHW